MEIKREQILFEVDIQFLSRQAFEEIMRYEVYAWVFATPNGQSVVGTVEERLKEYDWIRVFEYFQQYKELELDDFEKKIIIRELTREVFEYVSSLINQEKNTLSKQIGCFSFVIDF